MNILTNLSETHFLQRSYWQLQVRPAKKTVTYSKLHRNFLQTHFIPLWMSSKSFGYWCDCCFIVKNAILQNSQVCCKAISLAALVCLAAHWTCVKIFILDKPCDAYTAIDWSFCWRSPARVKDLSKGLSKITPLKIHTISLHKTQLTIPKKHTKITKDFITRIQQELINVRTSSKSFISLVQIIPASTVTR